MSGLLPNGTLHAYCKSQVYILRLAVHFSCWQWSAESAPQTLYGFFDEFANQTLFLISNPLFGIHRPLLTFPYPSKVTAFVIVLQSGHKREEQVFCCNVGRMTHFSPLVAAEREKSPRIASALFLPATDFIVPSMHVCSGPR